MNINQETLLELEKLRNFQEEYKNYEEAKVDLEQEFADREANLMNENEILLIKLEKSIERENEWKEKLALLNIQLKRERKENA